MIYLIAIGGLLWIMFRCGFWRSILFFGVTVLAAALIAAGFAFGGLISYMVYPEVVQKWYLLPSITDNWMRTHDTFAPMMAVPFLFVLDCFIWVIHITLTQGTWILWVTMAMATYSAVYAYSAWLGAVLSDEQRAIMLSWLKNTPPPPAKPARRNGYDAKGNFIGFDYDPHVGNIKYDNRGNRIN